MARRAEEGFLWADRDLSGTWADLDHPADLWLEIKACDPAGLFENSLYALYSQIVEPSAVRPAREMVLEAEGDEVATALRGLLAEALFRLRPRLPLRRRRGDRTAEPEETGPADPASPETPRVWVSAHLWGETVDPARHELLAEIKAVTYHGLAAGPTPDGGWRATVLLDV